MKRLTIFAPCRMPVFACVALWICSASSIFSATETPSVTRVEPPKIIELIEPVYPLGMTMQGIVRGEVDLVFGVDAQGKLDDYMVTSYSRQEFADEVMRAVKKWTFTPMMVDGSPVWSRTRVKFSFAATGVVISRTVMDSISMLAGEMVERGQYVHVLSRQSELDRTLQVTHAVSPLYPAQLAESKQSGTVTVEFFVDEQGRVRLPIVEGDAHPWFGDAATQALLQWRFEPPMKKGRPTVVTVRQQFVFKPEPVVENL